LVQELLNEDSGIRVFAAEALWQIGDARALEPLLSVLGEDDPALRDYAAKALSKMPDRRVVDALTKLLDDGSDAVRFSAVASLKKQSEALGFDARPMLRCIVAEDSAERVQKLAAMYLEELGEPETAERFWGKKSE